MNIEEYVVDERKIIVIDDFFSSIADKDRLYLAASTLPFQVTGKNFDDVQNRSNLRLTADVSEQMCQDIGLFQPERQAILNKEASPQEYQVYQSYCNLGLVSDHQHPHIDSHDPGAGKTLLIFCNKVWEEAWGGGTHFYSDDLKKIIYSSPNRSGRAILFDGSIPHMASVQHLSSQQYRFTIVIKFIKRGLEAKKASPYTS